MHNRNLFTVYYFILVFIGRFVLIGGLNYLRIRSK